MTWWLDDKLKEQAKAPLAGVYGRDVARVGDWTRFDDIGWDDRWRREFISAYHGELVPSLAWQGIQRRKVIGGPIPPDAVVFDSMSKRLNNWLGLQRQMISAETIAWVYGVPLNYVTFYLFMVEPESISVVTRNFSRTKEFRQYWVHASLCRPIGEGLEDLGVPVVSGGISGVGNPQSQFRWAILFLWRSRRLNLSVPQLREYGRRMFRGLNPWKQNVKLEETQWHSRIPNKHLWYRGHKREKQDEVRLDSIGPVLRDRLRRSSPRVTLRTTKSLLPPFFAFRQRAALSSRWFSTFLNRSAGT